MSDDADQFYEKETVRRPEAALKRMPGDAAQAA
jgi:hypothetical protein